MADESSIVRDVQLAIRRELDRRGKSLKVIALDSGLPYSTLLSYFPGDRDAVPHAMPVASLRKLIGHVPADLLSLLLPDGFVILRVPEALDHDEIAEGFGAYLAAKQGAHHPASECGRDIGPVENTKLTTLAVIAGGKAAA